MYRVREYLPGYGYPVLTALDGRISTWSGRSSRLIPADEFATGPGKTVLESYEIIREIVIPVRDGILSSFYKYMPRKAQGLAKISVAAALRIDDGRIEHVRIALGAVGPTVIRAVSAENLLLNRSPGGIDLSEVAMAVSKDARPIDDFRSTKQYRTFAVRSGTRRVLDKLFSR
ncbi:FAD binding domain-containing protein [bacterium]|nr:FAD binding domain-containing protein [candidate division CSSED10-310 bacterium]